jgi:hypothetical protein
VLMWKTVQNFYSVQWNWNPNEETKEAMCNHTEERLHIIKLIDHFKSIVELKLKMHYLLI